MKDLSMIELSRMIAFVATISSQQIGSDAISATAGTTPNVLVLETQFHKRCHFFTAMAASTEFSVHS